MNNGPVRHGIAEATLESGYMPGLECLCGFVATGDTWSLAGEALDDHLDERPNPCTCGVCSKPECLDPGE